MQPVPSPPVSTSGPVEAARARLEGIDALTTLEQVEAFDAVHRLLQDALVALEGETRAESQPDRQASRAGGPLPGRL